MGIQKMKLLTGTMLALLVSAVSAYPVIARPVSPESRLLLSQVYTSDIAKGTISRINGEMVTLALPSGGTQQITIDEDYIRRLNLRPGMEVVVNLNRGNIARGVRVVDANMTTAMQSVRGTIRSIDDNVVMLEMPDGRMQRITLRQEDITRLNLQPGTQITVMLNDERMASNVSVIEVDTTATISPSVTTVRREETVTQRRTVETMPAPPVMQTTEFEETTTVTQPVETEAAPVRALW
jgi:antitoxin component of MazEF toxin-antitoxin module